MNCIICNNPAPVRMTKKGVDYYQCVSCRTLFSEPLNNANMVGGGNEVERNKIQNPERIARFLQLFDNKKEDIGALDWGCGHALLVKDMRAAGIDAEGFDPYNPEYSGLIIEHGKYNLVIMVEVVEHLTSEFREFDIIREMLVPGGVLYIESSFVDIPQEDNILLENWSYATPEVGHCTLFSHHGLDLALAIKGFLPSQHFNRNARCFIKP